MQTIRTPDGALAVRQSAPVAAKLFGIPFLAVGGWFLWQLVLAIIDAFRAPSIGEALSVIPGVLLLIIIGALFAVPGLLLMFGTRLVSVDPATNDLLATRDFVLFRRSERHHREDIAAVAVAEKRISSSTARKQRWALHVEAELKRRNDRFVLIALADTLEDARAIATQFAAAIGVSMIDRSSEDEVDEEELADEA